MATIKFNSKVKDLGVIPQTFRESEIKNETMLFSADKDFAAKNGDALTNLFLDYLPSDWHDSKLIIDSRVHMLMPGWYPCIPGWHHDDVPRYGRFGQPNYENPEYYSEHLLWVVNADIAPTYFLSGEVEVNIPKPHKVVYGEWDREIDVMLGDNCKPECVAFPVQDSRLYLFDWETFHKGSAAVKNGWRFFIRASRYWNDKEKTIPNHSRFQRRTDKNQIRRQVQTYMATINQGW